MWFDAGMPLLRARRAASLVALALLVLGVQSPLPASAVPTSAGADAAGGVAGTARNARTVRKLIELTE